jgi:hypothetical protein
MADSDKTREIFFDAPTKALLWLVGGLAALVVGLSVRTYLQLPKTPNTTNAPTNKPKATPKPRPRPTPTPAPENVLRIFRANEIRPRLWQVEQENDELLRLVSPSGAVFEQRLLSLDEGMSPRTIAERLDAKMSGWGQEYQRIRASSVERGGQKMTRLEYALNIPGKPSQRSVTIIGRVRVGGQRRVASWTLASTDENLDTDRVQLNQSDVKL